MTTPLTLTSIGRKAFMASTGLILLLFVISHLMGNLLIFLGPDALNAYALKLRHLGAGLWFARGVLLAAVVVHSVTSIQLSLENRAARPIRYGRYQTAEATLSSRTMLLSGLLVLAYLVYHLLHFTFQTAHPEVAHLTEAQGHHDVYRMVVVSFQQPPISLVYIVAMALLFSHLRHGIASAFQSLGVNNERTLAAVECVGAILSWALFLGYSAIPIAVLSGIVK